MVTSRKLASYYLKDQRLGNFLMHSPRDLLGQTKFLKKPLI